MLETTLLCWWGLPNASFQYKLWLLKSEVWKPQKVKVSKYGALVLNVHGKEVAGFFWGGIFHKISNGNTKHSRLGYKENIVLD